MAQEFDNKNTGMLSTNLNKEKPSHPDVKGQLNVDGVEYWISGWTRVAKEGSKMAGKKFLSLSVQPKEKQAAPPPPISRPVTKPALGFDALDDDIPFATSSMFYDMTTSKQRKMAQYNYKGK
jgi:hypothetical protein